MGFEMQGLAADNIQQSPVEAYGACICTFSATELQTREPIVFQQFLRVTVQTSSKQLPVQRSMRGFVGDIQRPPSLRL